MTRSPWLWAAGLTTYGFLYVPLAVVVLFSFNDSELNASWVGFTTRWYGILLADDNMLQAAANSLFIAIVASTVATVLGTMAGIAMHRWRPKLLPFLVLTPVAMPEILLGVSLLLFFRQVLDLTLGLVSILIAHVSFSIGFVAVIVRARLKTRPIEQWTVGRVEEADAVLREGLARVKDDAPRFPMLLLRGDVLARRGDAVQSLRAYEDAKRACGACGGPGQPIVYFRLGASYASQSPPLKSEAMANLQAFHRVICKGLGAMPYNDECTQTQALAVRMGGALH